MLSIDRFEGGYAVCVDDEENIVNIKKSLIEGNAVSGDIIEEKDSIYVILKDETKRRKEEIKKLQDELFQ
ncbi:MAG: DUF3006 domain-containing protein [Ruminococcus sp.]|nr:DUF3006 domain-containing protein [Ruminococcus sp.]